MLYLPNCELQGNYIEALLAFDKVLAKGFSGQVFMSGLSQHMRDLLVIKSNADALTEFPAGILARYREQAVQCDVEFLFGAISQLSTADGAIRTSSNQRLLVELTLMRIAEIGKKKTLTTTNF